MDNLTLRKVQLAEILVLDEIHRLCEKHKIQYYLAGGTLLGAVRHKGFIPWDDDLDISMPREDYNRFIEISRTELDSRFELQTVELEPLYNLFIGKVRIKKTKLVDRTVKDLDINQGIYVDIFPLDYCNGINLSLKIRAKLFSILAKIKAVKLGIANEKDVKRRILVRLTKIFTRFLSLNYLNKMVDKILTYQKSGIMHINFCSQYGFKKQTMPTNWFGKGCLIEFEGKKYCAPKEYKKVLKNIYGEYMKLPPKEKQKTVHDFIEVNLGNYEMLVEEMLKSEKV